MNENAALLIEELQKLEFIHCNIRHEQSAKDAAGNIIFNGEYPVADKECPRDVQGVRPGCPHFLRARLEADDSIMKSLQFIQVNARDQMEHCAKALAQYTLDRERLLAIDDTIRQARLIPLLLTFGNPTAAEDAKKEESTLQEEHRGIVERMRKLRDDTVNVLGQNAHVQAV